MPPATLPDEKRTLFALSAWNATEKTCVTPSGPAISRLYSRHGRLVHRPRFRFTPELAALAGRRGADSDPATTTLRGTDSHEERHPPGVHDHRGHLLLRQHLLHPQH